MISMCRNAAGSRGSYIPLSRQIILACSKLCERRRHSTTLCARKLRKRSTHSRKVLRQTPRNLRVLCHGDPFLNAHASRLSTPHPLCQEHPADYACYEVCGCGKTSPCAGRCICCQALCPRDS